MRYKGRELVAGNGGTPGTVPVLGEKERLKWTVRIPHDVMASLRTDEERIEAVMVPSARFLDKLGNQHEIEAEPLP